MGPVCLFSSIAPTHLAEFSETLAMLRYNANSLHVHYFALLYIQHWEMNEYSVKVLGMAAVQMVSLLLSETTTKAVQILARY